MSLTNEQFRKLQSLLVRACQTHDTLALFARLRLDAPLDHLIPPDKPVPESVFYLIDKCEREGRTGQLLQGLASWQCQDSEVLSFCAEFTIRPGAAGNDVQGSAREFGRGLGALHVLLERMAEPGVLLIIGRGQGVFESCRDRIHWLQQYKALHDGLHTLQAMLASIGFAAAQFTQTPVAHQTLDQALVDLRELVRTARESAAGLPTEEAEQAWIAVFDQTITALGGAVEADDAQGVGEAVGHLRGLLKQSIEVNDHLVFVARDLQLSRLLAALQAVNDRLGAGGSAELSLFRAGLDALRRLGIGLGQMTREHDAWQNLETEFALAETQPGVAPREKFLNWPKVRDQLAGLCALHGDDPLARDLSVAVSQYESAPLGRTPRAFLTLRATFSKTFFKIDARLLDLALELARQADQLDRLVEFLTDLTTQPAGFRPPSVARNDP